MKELERVRREIEEIKTVDDRVKVIKLIKYRLANFELHYLEREKLEKELHELKAKEEEENKDQNDFLTNLLNEEALKMKEESKVKKEIQEVRIKVLGREKQLVALRKWREKKGTLTKKELIKLYADNTITREELDKTVELRDKRLQAEIKNLNDTIELWQKQRDYLWKEINKKAVELKDLEHELEMVF